MSREDLFATIKSFYYSYFPPSHRSCGDSVFLLASNQPNCTELRQSFSNLFLRCFRVSGEPHN